MRYIGGKSLLLDNLGSVIENEVGWDNISSVVDIFSGSGVVSRFFKQKGKYVHTNDNLYYAYVLSRGTTALNSYPDFENIATDIFEYLNNIPVDLSGDLEKCFVYNNYSPNSLCRRMYFQNENAVKIDVIRQRIEAWRKARVIDENAYYYLLAALLNAVPYVANITGTFGAYLKYWDKRTYKPLTLEKPRLISTGACVCHNEDYTALLPAEADLLYADPPYNSREYLPNYHVMETIARYDAPALHGVTGMREYESQRSVFCKKASVRAAFDDLIGNTHCRYVLISYNNEGLISTQELSAICRRYAVNGSFKLYEFPYRRYKNKIPNNKTGLKEQLYFLRRR